MIEFTDSQLYAVEKIAEKRGDEVILRHAAEEFAEASAALNLDLPLKIETKVGEVLLRTIDRYFTGTGK